MARPLRVNVRGDWGRDMVLYLARKRSGLTLAQLGEKAGGLTYKTASQAIQRMASRVADDRKLARLARSIESRM